MSTDVGRMIRTARERAGLSPADLARLVGYNQSTVSRWESNKGRPTRDAPQRLVEVLGLNPDEFYLALGTTAPPAAAVDVESALRADSILTAGEKAQVLNLYNYFRSARDKHDRAADVAFDAWEAAEPTAATNSDDTESSPHEQRC